MIQVAGLIPTYSSDEFGICSALYELGGMVVMHDASGCNSTYTTHDEPRWYDMDSMIFISAISEMEAIMGDDDKLIEDLVETAEELRPAFIAIVGAPIPYMIGTDLKAIAAITEERTGIPCMGLEANGMHDYTRGISMALEAVIDRFVSRNVKKSERLSVNILGATPLDFALNGSIDSIRAWLGENGIEVNSCLAMGSKLEEIQMAGQAQVNLVISSGGLAAAKRLQKLFDQPYVVGVPMGKQFSDYVLGKIHQAAKTGISLNAYRAYEMDGIGKKEMSVGSDREKDETKNASEKRMIIGEAVYSASLAVALELEYGKSVQVLCPLEKHEELLREQDLYTPEEDDICEAISTATCVAADPFYKALCKKEMKFINLPHEAFSGRIYDAVNPNLIGESLMNYFDERIKRC